MKNYIVFFSLLLLIACTQRKITTVKVLNKNNYPITFTVKANNCALSLPHIASGKEISGELDFTNIIQEGGQWFLFVKNEQSGGTDSFAHGYFPNGELSNYLDVESMGDQLKVSVTE